MPLTADERTQLADLAESVLSVSRRLTARPGEGAIHLSPLESLVMRQVDLDPGITPSRLAHALGLRSSNTSAALRGLETRGFIRREVDPADGRGVRVYPTPVAHENLERKRALWVDLLAPHLEDPAGLPEALALLRRIDASFARSPA